MVKYVKYRSPKNVEFLHVPQVNKPVWSNLSTYCKSSDLGLQTIQKDLLMSAIPSINVMQQLNAAEDGLSQLNARDLVKTLSDSLTFLGYANVAMVLLMLLISIFE